jgi:hypothetical protein
MLHAASLYRRSSTKEVDRAIQRDGLTCAARRRRKHTNPADDIGLCVWLLMEAAPEERPLRHWALAVELQLIGQGELAHEEARAYLHTRPLTETEQALEKLRLLVA